MEEISALTRREYKELNNSIIEDSDKQKNVSISNSQMVYQLLSFMLIPFALLYFAINILGVYTHIDAQKLPKQLTGPTLYSGGKDNFLSPYSDYFDQKDVHNGDYLVSSYDIKGTLIARSEVPLKAGKININSFKSVDHLEDKMKQLNSFDLGFRSYIVHTKEHDIIDWKKLLYVSDSASLVALIAILNFNLITRQKKNRAQAIGY